jgi:hypothetical protein
MSIEPILQSTLTCPQCGHVKTETMPTDACQWFYECEGCHVLLKPRPGDCCVFCSIRRRALPADTRARQGFMRVLIGLPVPFPWHHRHDRPE